jgi:methyl-accepting chemotaxis protein
LKISETAWGNYQEIASDIAKINAAIHQIATINTEQRINVEQINDAIGQISQSSLSNAALASMLDEAVHKVTGHLENLENVIHQRNLS